MMRSWIFSIITPVFSVTWSVNVFVIFFFNSFFMINKKLRTANELTCISLSLLISFIHTCCIQRFFKSSWPQTFKCLLPLNAFLKTQVWMFRNRREIIKGLYIKWCAWICSAIRSLFWKRNERFGYKCFYCTIYISFSVEVACTERDSESLE